MKKAIIIFLLGFFVLPFTAEASDKDSGRAYIFVGYGIDSPREEIDVPLYFSDIGVRTETDSGFSMHIGGGLYVLEKLRLEGEAAYRKSDIDDASVRYNNALGLGVSGGEGKIRSLSLMANAWYDIFSGRRLSFYLGGGIGAAQASVKDFSVNTYPIMPNPIITKRELIDDDEWMFAYQAGVGVGFRIYKNITTDLGYRYYATSNRKMDDVAGNAIDMDDSHNNNFLLTVRYGF